MAKTVISRNFRYPSAELRDRVRLAVKERGFRSEQAFLVAACERELRESDNAEATEQLEARIAATLVNMANEVQSLFTLAHTQVALTNSLLQYVLTCVVEPPEDVLPAARARAQARYAKILRRAAQEVATRNKSHFGTGVVSRQTTMRKKNNRHPPVANRLDQRFRADGAAARLLWPRGFDIR